MDNEDQPQKSLSEDEISVSPNHGRRSFLKIAGLGVVGVAAVAGAATAAAGHHDFPKGSSDSDTTQNKDLKAVDSDANDSKAVDSDQNRLRNVKRSSDSD